MRRAREASGIARLAGLRGPGVSTAGKLPVTIRTTTKTVRFARPFALRGVDHMLPAGTYAVETDEEPLDGVSMTAYRRTQTRIHLRNLPGQPGKTRIVTIDSKDLDVAPARDAAYRTPNPR